MLNLSIARTHLNKGEEGVSVRHFHVVLLGKLVHTHLLGIAGE